MFNKELFYDLCNRYGVELSDKYDRPMVKINGEIRPVDEQDVRNLLPRCDDSSSDR